MVLSDSAVLIAGGSRLITNGDNAIEASGSSRIVFDGGTVDGINDTAILFNDAATGTFRETELGSVTLNGTSAADFFETVVRTGADADTFSVSDDSTARFFDSTVEIGGDRGFSVTDNAALELNGTSVSLSQSIPFTVSGNADIKVVSSSIAGGSNASSGNGVQAFDVLDQATGVIESGTFQAGASSQGDASVFFLGNDADLTIEGGIFLEQGGAEPGSRPAGPLATLGDSSSLTLLGDLSTFLLDGAMLDPADADGVVTVSALTGTLDGVLSNGDLLTDFRFERSAASTLQLVNSAGPAVVPDPPVTSDPSVVPSPTSAAAGLVLLAGLTRRRRR